MTGGWRKRGGVKSSTVLFVSEKVDNFGWSLHFYFIRVSLLLAIMFGSVFGHNSIATHSSDIEHFPSFLHNLFGHNSIATHSSDIEHFPSFLHNLNLENLTAR